MELYKNFPNTLEHKDLGNNAKDNYAISKPFTNRISTS
jgi:hypothetical protein